MFRRTPVTLALAGAALAIGTAGILPASADGGSPSRSTRLAADLDALNNSGVDGTLTVRSTPRQTLQQVKLQASGLTPDGPHAVHIHYGEQAAHECPTFRDDANGDFRLNVAEGVPQYGPIAVSLTTRGDTSAASGLALDRMPVAEDGALTYLRYNLPVKAVTDVDGSVIPAADVAAAIRRGEGVVVVHGIDYNGDGAYGESGAGASELDPSGAIPAEATDPVACGVLARH